MAIAPAAAAVAADVDEMVALVTNEEVREAALRLHDDIATRVHRAILEDRYDGALVHGTGRARAGEIVRVAGDYNERQLKLDTMIRDLWEFTARDDYPDNGLPAVEDAERAIRQIVVDSVAAWVAARKPPES